MKKSPLIFLITGTAVVGLIAFTALAQAPGGRGGSGRGGANNDLGYTDTPLVPGQQWHVHDPARPHPPKVTPGENTSWDAPSDAVILFDGKDL